MEGTHSFPALLSSWVKDGFCKINQTEIKFENGSQISLEHCADERILSKHQGIERHVRVFEEAAQIKERYIRWLRAWVTMSEDMLARVPDKWKGMFPRIIYTSNPIGVSAGYFRREFVKARPREAIERVSDLEGGFLRQYIPARVEDNPSEDADRTRARVSGIADEATADALLNENWDAPVGDFIREFREQVNGRPYNVVPDFMPPPHWLKFRAFDWGSAEPFCVLWFAISDGENFTDHLGRERWFRRGCVCVYREWYGNNPAKPAEGCGLTNKEIAAGILARTTEITTNVTVTDSLPFQNRGAELMADEFAKAGVPLTLGATERIAGWKRVKDHFTGIDGFPMLVICESCTNLRDYVPALQRHKTKMEDAVEDGEATHACDTLRLGVMTRPRVKDAPRADDAPVNTATPTFEHLMKKHFKQKKRGADGY